MIQYLNTDLDLRSIQELTVLVRAFDLGGASPLHCTKGDDGRWYATLETNDQHEEPETSISRMLQIIESFSEPLQLLWKQCTRREFNIGYSCGDGPWAFNQGLSSELLGRIAAVDAALRITIYPDRKEGAAGGTDD